MNISVDIAIFFVVGIQCGLFASESAGLYHWVTSFHRNILTFQFQSNVSGRNFVSLNQPHLPPSDNPSTLILDPARPVAELIRSGASVGGDWINATDYDGVDNTGSRESTIGLTNAISDSALKGKVLRLPCGVYLTDNVPIASSARIEGSRRGCAIIRRKEGAIGHYAASAKYVHDFALTGIVFDANGSRNVDNPGTSLSITHSFRFQISGIQTQGGNSVDGANFGVGAFISDCQDGVEGSKSAINNSVFAGNNSGATTLTGLLVQRCSNLSVERNVSYGHSQAGIALADPTLPVPTTATSTSVSFVGNHTYGNGIGIDVAGFSAGYGIGGGQLWTRSNFVNSNIVVTDNKMNGNSLYGCVLQARGLTVTGNLIQGNGTNTSFGGCAVSSTEFVVAENTIIENSYYGLDVGGSSAGQLIGNVIHRNGKAIGRGVGLNVGATVDLRIGPNDIGANGGPHGGWEVLASALDGSGPGNFFPWLGSNLQIDGLKVTIADPAMGGVSIKNGWNGVVLRVVWIDNFVGSLHPFDAVAIGSNGPSSNLNMRGTDGTWSHRGVSTLMASEQSNISNRKGKSAASPNPIHKDDSHVLDGQLLQITPSDMGANYTAGARINCTSNGRAPATAEAAVSADGKIYGGYIGNPGKGASTMSCTVSDQVCTAKPGAVRLSGGAVVSIASGVGGAGCVKPPAVVIDGLGCTIAPQVFSTVSNGAVSGYVVGYGGFGCKGNPTAAIANGYGFIGVVHLSP